MTHPELYARAAKLGFPALQLRQARRVGAGPQWWTLLCSFPRWTDDHADADKALAKLEARE